MGTTSISLTVDVAIPLKVISVEENMTGAALQAIQVETPAIRPVWVAFHCLQIFSLDS